jgi:hypothetical protein
VSAPTRGNHFWRVGALLNLSAWGRTCRIRIIASRTQPTTSHTYHVTPCQQWSRTTRTRRRQVPPPETPHLRGKATIGIPSGETKKVRFARCGTTRTRRPTMWSTPARSQATAVGGVKPVICNGQRRARLVVALRTERVLAGQGSDVVVWRAGTAPRRVGSDDVGVDEARPALRSRAAWWAIVHARLAGERKRQWKVTLDRVRRELPTPGRCGVPASVILEAGVGTVLPHGHEGVAPIDRTLDLRQPVAIRRAPGQAILGQPLAEPGAGLPPDRVRPLSPELAGRGGDQVTRGGQPRFCNSRVEHVF